MKPTLAFVDHSFHRKTRSGDFLREIFSKDFEITDYWDEKWCGGNSVSVDDINQHDYVFYFQSLTPLNKLHLVRAKMIWAPMYDGLFFDYYYWNAVSKFPIKILSFSSKVDRHVRLYGLNSYKTRYYLPSVNYQHATRKKKTIYFWYRGSLKLSELLRVINPIQINKIIIRVAPDPKYQIESISTNIIQKYKLNIVDDKDFNKELHAQLLKKCDIFVSPRKKEGIGIATLEAMSQGKCIIAWDSPTMNEYIKNKHSGYLINDNAKEFLDLSISDSLRDQMIKDYQEGYKNWLYSSKKLNSFILNTPFRNRIRNPIVFYYAAYSYFFSICSYICKKIKMIIK